MGRRLWLGIGILVVALVAAGVPLGLTYRHHRVAREQRIAAAAFAGAWTRGTLSQLRFAGSSGADVAKAVAQETAGLTVQSKDAPSSVQITRIRKGSGSDSASAGLAVSWRLAGQRTWTYASTLPLRKVSGTWLPSWTPSIIHPKLQTGGRLIASVQPAARGEIIGADNTVLVTQRPVVVVGLQPSRTEDIDASAQQIADVTGIEATGLAKRAKAASKDAFVEAIVLRRQAYDEVRGQLQPIPGAVFQERDQSLAPTADFARPILGTVGAATADVVKASKGRVTAGDITGLSGLQRSQDELLAGTPGLLVRLEPANGPVSTLFSDEPVTGQDLHITLDEKVQLAAQRAILKAPKPAGIVVLRASTGDILAVANGPSAASGYNRALLGQYPPGSTFKIVSAMALLKAGYSPNTPVACPASINVGGRTFQNAENEVLGTVAFHHDFADSCNTAFVGSSSKITQKELAATAKSLGYGAGADLGVSAFTGDVPAGGDAVAHAASMIGQDKVLASPLTVAGTAAAIDAGTYHPPRLLLNGTADRERSTGTAASPRASTGSDPQAAPSGEPSAAFTPPEPAGGVDLDPGRVAALRTMMREVVTSGTGTPLKSAAGGPVSGKTGTAEFGPGDPPKTHAWFTGFQGDIAFAVVVEDGGFGAETAAPIARDLLDQLA